MTTYSIPFTTFLLVLLSVLVLIDCVQDIRRRRRAKARAAEEAKQATVWHYVVLPRGTTFIPDGMYTAYGSYWEANNVQRSAGGDYQIFKVTLKKVGFEIAKDPLAALS